MTNPESKKHDAESFAQQAEGKTSSMVGEFFGLLRHNRKWWLIPVIAVLVLFGALVLLLGTSAAPLIYTLF